MTPSTQTTPIVFEKLAEIRIEGCSCSAMEKLLRSVAAYGRAFVRHAKARKGERLMAVMGRALDSSADRAIVQGGQNAQVTSATRKGDADTILRAVAAVTSLIQTKTKRLKQREYRAASRVAKRTGESKMSEAGEYIY